MAKLSADVEIISTESALERALAYLHEHTLIALDTEFERRSTYFPKPALLQLRAHERSFLVDPLAFNTLDSLFELLSGKEVVMHACREDLEVFRELSNVRIAQFYDTQIAASLLGMDSQLSYQNLVENILGTKLEKTETCSDWLLRPLSTEQLEYALDDVLYLEPIYEYLLDELEKKGRVTWYRQEMEFIYELIDSAQETDYFFKIKGIGRFDRNQLSCIYDLLIWRERLAKKKNIPRGFIIKDKVLVELAESITNPGQVNKHRLSNINDMPPAFLRKYADEVIELAQNPCENDAKQQALAMASRELPKSSKVLKKDIKKFRDTKALGLELKAEFLLSNRLLESLLYYFYFDCQSASEEEREKKFISILKPWRYAIFEDYLKSLEIA